MHNHLRNVKGYNREDKLAETISLGLFATNVLNICKEKGIPIRATFSPAGIRPECLYEMRKGNFTRFINHYTMIRISRLIGEPISRLLSCLSEDITDSTLITNKEVVIDKGIIKMTQKQYASFRGVSQPAVCWSVKQSLKKNSLSSLPGVVHIDKFSSRQYVLYVKI